VIEHLWILTIRPIRPRKLVFHTAVATAPSKFQSNLTCVRASKETIDPRGKRFRFLSNSSPLPPLRTAWFLDAPVSNFFCVSFISVNVGTTVAKIPIAPMTADLIAHVLKSNIVYILL